jgi:hypothetical protein
MLIKCCFLPCRDSGFLIQVEMVGGVISVIEVEMATLGA